MEKQADVKKNYTVKHFDLILAESILGSFYGFCPHETATFSILEL